MLRLILYASENASNDEYDENICYCYAILVFWSKWQQLGNSNKCSKTSQTQLPPILFAQKKEKPYGSERD